MTNQPDFDVFLAHNSQNKPQVKAIATKLKRRGLKVWLDEEQIAPGRAFQDVIQQAISNVKSAAIFIGTEGLGKWQILELRSLISRLVEADIP
ncbi:transcriptional regulator, partial [Brasilonema sennae CENA114]